MENKKEKATKAQRDRIENMLKSGLINREEAQEIIEGGLARENRFAIWESRCPGKGKAIADLLRPFYGWAPVLTPARFDLEALTKEAIFWRPITAVRICKQSEVDLTGGDSIGLSFWNSIWAKFGGLIGPPLWDFIESWLDESFAEELLAWPTNPFGETELPNWFGHWLFYAVAFTIIDKVEEAAKFKLVLDLWLTGNIPFAFDGDNNLLVLVADE